MKVFVSWSGELSQSIAKVLKKWIPCIIQSVEVFYSSEDIEKGENWDAKVSKELSDCNYGIVCLTPDNVGAPWIHFEAGAISKTLDSKVTALMLGVNPSDIKGPLSRFQATKADKEDFLQMLEEINKASENSLEPEVLKNTFEAIWLNINHAIQEAIGQYAEQNMKAKPNKAESINSSELLEEILQLVRKQNQLISSPDQLLPIGYLAQIKKALNEELDESNVMNIEILEEIVSWIEHITNVLIQKSELFFIINKLEINIFIDRIRMFIHKGSRNRRTMTFDKRLASCVKQIELKQVELKQINLDEVIDFE